MHRCLTVLAGTMKSRPYGHCERNVFRQIDRNTRDRILRAVRKYDRSTARLAGKRKGPLGLIALEIYEWFVCLNVNSSRLDPSIDYLAAKFRHARSSIVAALRALREHGFLKWVRRYKVARTEGQKGPQIYQTSNAYRVELPPEAEKLLEDVPTDEKARKEDVRRRLMEYEAQESGLSDVLDRLGALVFERERRKSENL